MRYCDLANVLSSLENGSNARRSLNSLTVCREVFRAAAIGIPLCSVPAILSYSLHHISLSVI